MSLVEAVVGALAGERPLGGMVRQSVRTHPVMVDGHRRKTEQCESCGVYFAISPRTLRAKRANGSKLRCDTCRSNPVLRVTPALKAYWTERFDEDDIVEMAIAIFGRERLGR